MLADLDHTTTSPACFPELLNPAPLRSLSFSIFQLLNRSFPAAMAMAMGVASMAVTVPRNASLVCRASATNRGEKEGFLDWFRSALDKDSLSETDDVLAKVDGGKSDGKSDGKAAPAGKKAIPLPPLKKAGFNFFGKK